MDGDGPLAARPPRHAPSQQTRVVRRSSCLTISGDFANVSHVDVGPAFHIVAYAPGEPIVEPTFILIVVVAVIAAAYFLFIRRRALPPHSEAASEKLLPKEREDRATKSTADSASRATDKPKRLKSDAPGPAAARVAARSSEAAPETGPALPPRAGASTSGREAAEAAEDQPATGAPVSRARDVEGLRQGLSKVRASDGFFGRLRALFGGRREIDPQVLEQIEEVLLTSDVGVKTTQVLLDDLRTRFDGDHGAKRQFSGMPFAPKRSRF